MWKQWVGVACCSVTEVEKEEERKQMPREQLRLGQASLGWDWGAAHFSGFYCFWNLKFSSPLALGNSVGLYLHDFLKPGQWYGNLFFFH